MSFIAASVGRRGAPGIVRRALGTWNAPQMQQKRGFIHRTFEDVKEAGNHHIAASGTWESRRYLLRKDGMGFSFHHTILYEGTSTLIWYRNHVEAVFITQGEGEIELVDENQKEGEGVVYPLKPGTLYGLNGHERHYLRATKGDLHVACAFNPPVAGSEDHNDQGVYPVVDDADNKIYDYSVDDLQELIKPPQVMANKKK
eukprot:gb/GECG01014857.1/.p1 GENE.gb/GECG01014857.1/~~gb/GECG01014857.1/.p1  ORF type:complete len:200 (+),score=36.53 gb/GECG01014857.1/:1-600(+)